MTSENGGIPVDFIKAAADHCKHITTLASGFILVMVAFLDDLFVKPKWTGCVVISFVAFTLAIVFAVYSQALMIDYLYPDKEIDTAKKAQHTSVILIGTWVCFLLGTISLMVFGIINFI